MPFPRGEFALSLDEASSVKKLNCNYYVFTNCHNIDNQAIFDYLNFNSFRYTQTFVIEIKWVFLMNVVLPDRDEMANNSSSLWMLLWMTLVIIPNCWVSSLNISNPNTLPLNLSAVSVIHHTNPKQDKGGAKEVFNLICVNAGYLFKSYNFNIFDAFINKSPI